MKHFSKICNSLRIVSWFHVGFYRVQCVQRGLRGCRGDDTKSSLHWLLGFHGNKMDMSIFYCGAGLKNEFARLDLRANEYVHDAEMQAYFEEFELLQATKPSAHSRPASL